MTQTAKKDRKKLALLTLLVVLLIAAAALGTMAWLTAQDSVTNTFTVGNFNKPTDPEDRPDPDKEIPDGEKPEEPNISEDGYIIEPSWDTASNVEHKLVPGGSLYKDPYVGIGAGSEDAQIYVYVENPFGDNAVYFSLTEAWEPVEGQVTIASVDGVSTDIYTGGLFHYTGDDKSDILKANATDDVWTNRPVFKKVVVNDNASTKDLNIEGEKNIVVSCFIHQAYDGDGTKIPENTIQAAAIKALVPDSQTDEP